MADGIPYQTFPSTPGYCRGEAPRRYPADPHQPQRQRRLPYPTTNQTADRRSGCQNAAGGGVPKQKNARVLPEGGWGPCEEDDAGSLSATKF